MTAPVLVSDLLPLYRKLAADEQDSVRLLTVEALIAVAQTLEKLAGAEGQELIKQNLLQTMRTAWQDRSWRVRYMVGLHFTEVNFSLRISTPESN